MRSLRPLASRTLADRAAEKLREQILAGHLAGGDRLVEARIAQQLGISRGPLREALKQLAAEGLVHDEPRRGTFVSMPTPQAVREAYDLRAAIEAKAARLVIANGDRIARDTLAGAAESIEAASRDGDLQRVVRADYEFHETLCRASGNGRLLDAFVRNASVLRILLRLEGEHFYRSLDEVADQHRQLVSAVEAGDAAAADAAVTQHLEFARDRLMQHLAAKVDAEASRERASPGTTRRR